MNSENHLKDKLIACGHDDSVHFTSPGLRAFLLFRDGSFYTVSPVSAHVYALLLSHQSAVKRLQLANQTIQMQMFWYVTVFYTLLIYFIHWFNQFEQMNKYDIAVKQIINLPFPVEEI